MILTGNIKKMETFHKSPIKYDLPIGPDKLPMNDLLGKKIEIKFEGDIHCLNCKTKIKKSFNQGFCFPCFRKLASCDQCIMRPELCHYHENTCREPEWGEKHCLIPHTVYLAISSGVKVGITRKHQQKTRWMDQGAIEALPIATVDSRLDSGLVEVALKKHVADKTNWRAMLKGDIQKADLIQRKKELVKYWPKNVKGEILSSEKIETFKYPVLEYPKKVVSHNLDKINLLEGQLLGLLGQYLILDTAVINVRKYGGYHLKIKFD